MNLRWAYTVGKGVDHVTRVSAGGMEAVSTVALKNGSVNVS